MEEISREAKVGHGLQDERDEGHALGLGRYAEQSHFEGRTGHVRLHSVVSRVGPRVKLGPDANFGLPSRPRVVRRLSFVLLREWVKALDGFITLY